MLMSAKMPAECGLLRGCALTMVSSERGGLSTSHGESSGVCVCRAVRLNGSRVVFEIPHTTPLTICLAESQSRW